MEREQVTRVNIIGRLREIYGLNQTQFAAKSGIRQPRISAFENGSDVIGWEKFFKVLKNLRLKVRIIITIQDGHEIEIDPKD